MRPYLLESFRPNRDDGYTYAELIHLRANGHEIPGHWLTRAKREEDAAAEAQAEVEGMAADLAAAEKAREARLKATHDEWAPVIRAKLAEVEELKAEDAEAREAAREAVAAYLAAARSTASKFGEVAQIIRTKYGDAIRDHDGNPRPNSTGLDAMRNPLFEGERLHAVGRQEPWNDNVFSHRYFH